MWALCSLRRTSLKLGTCCWLIGCCYNVVTITLCEVTVLAQSTGLGSSFFQALGGTIKIFRSTIEILSDVPLIKTGDKAGASESILLNRAGISPFSFWLIIQQVWMVAVTSQECLHNTEQTAVMLSRGCLKCCPCLRIIYLTVTSVLHSIINGYKLVLALSVETKYTFPLAEKIKAFLADPSAPVATATTVVFAVAAAPNKANTKEDTEESDKDIGFSLFD
ncbi:60S acidic ribosomal protein P0 [Cricetulus griseus]|uniref:Large ribosomal subunit protein uL10 n=1 Tax=Cricetulus griseus TaxID=10029 RepID=G3HAW3_CRIGR|nr:60S acidic ribosomal protein P0 [Cricetulus griseus]